MLFFVENAKKAFLQLYDPNHIAYQRFRPDGAIAVLPLSDSHSSLVWMGSDVMTKDLMSIDEKEFIDRLNVALVSVLCWLRD